MKQKLSKNKKISGRKFDLIILFSLIILFLLLSLYLFNYDSFIIIIIKL